MAGDPQRFEKAMNQGHSAAWDQTWEQAAAFYRQALEEFPENSKALTSLGLALYELKKYPEALGFYQKASELAPADPIPLEKVVDLQERLGNLEIAAKVAMNAAELYAKNRDLNKAIEYWSVVVRITPENLTAHSRLALVHEKTGRKPQALMEYLAIAGLLQHAGEVQKALQTINHALQVVPESPEARQALAMLKVGQPLPRPRRLRGMTGILQPPETAEAPILPMPGEAPKTSPDPIQEARQLAMTTLAGLLFEGSTEESAPQTRRDLASIVKGSGIFGSGQSDQMKIAMHLSQVVDLQSRGIEREAISELERAIDAGLDHPAAYFDLGLLMISENRQESAIRNLQRAVTNVNFALGSRLALAQIYQRSGKSQSAMLEYLEALKLADTAVVASDQAEALSQTYEPIIEAQSQESNPENQKRLCENISDLICRPNWREHLTQARQQLPEQAVASQPLPLAELITATSSSILVESLSRVHQLAREGNNRTAMEEAFHALQFAPTYLPLHIFIGDILVQDKRLDDAIDKFTVVARSYSIRGETARAISLLRRVIELSPMDMNARQRLIDMLLARGQTDEGIREYIRLAEIYYNQADLNKARETYQQAIRISQGSGVDPAWKAKLLHRIADIDMQSLDWRQALKVYEQIRNISPGDQKARSMLIDMNFRLGQTSQAISELDNYIGHLLKTGQGDQARQLLETMVTENTTQPALRRRLAEIYRQQGKVEEAIAQLDSLGDILLEAGDREGAIKAIMAILALNPPNIQEYQQLLNQLQAQQ